MVVRELLSGVWFRLASLRGVPLCVGMALLASTAFAADKPYEESRNSSDKEWVIEIRPAENQAAATGVLPASKPVPQDPASAAASGPLVPRMTYQQAYAAIPFSREEYEANPGYRHDAALELMYGTLRPTTVIKQNIPYFSRYPDFIRNRFQIYPYPNMGGQHSMNMYYLWSTNAFTW